MHTQIHSHTQTHTHTDTDAHINKRTHIHTNTHRNMIMRAHLQQPLAHLLGPDALKVTLEKQDVGLYAFKVDLNDLAPELING